MVAINRENSLLEVYLAHLEDEDGLFFLDNILVVNEFTDVYADILGLPLVKEIEFNINLVLGTIPIHRAPYRIALVESEELK